MLSMGITFRQANSETEPLPTTFSLVARHAKWDDVVQVVALVVIHSVGRQIGIHNMALDVEAEAVSAVVADFAELGLCQASVM